jgi:hypothetical protein
MGHVKGAPKTGGRKKGTPNKPIGQFAIRLQEMGIDLIEELMKLIKDETKDAPSKSAKMTTLAGMLAYVYPTRKALALNPEDEEALNYIYQMRQMAEQDLQKVIENASDPSEHRSRVPGTAEQEA